MLEPSHLESNRKEEDIKRNDSSQTPQAKWVDIAGQTFDDLRWIHLPEQQVEAFQHPSNAGSVPLPLGGDRRILLGDKHQSESSANLFRQQTASKDMYHMRTP